jgi:hypothetical protein
MALTPDAGGHPFCAVVVIEAVPEIPLPRIGPIVAVLEEIESQGGGVELSNVPL